MGAFCHLHVVSMYSARRSLVRLDALMEKLQELGQTAVAIVDRDGLYGVVDFLQLAKESGIHAVVGCELSVLADVGDPPAIRPVTLLGRDTGGLPKPQPGHLLRAAGNAHGRTS